MDLFEHKIVCRKCNKEMDNVKIERNGFFLRALRCSKCHEKIIHPKDESEYNHFMNLRNKQFNVKMRFVGNSYAVSIPREIVNFMKEQEKMMDNMVRLCFEEFGRISINFNHNNNGKIQDSNLNKDKKELKFI